MPGTTEPNGLPAEEVPLGYRLDDDKIVVEVDESLRQSGATPDHGFDRVRIKRRQSPFVAAENLGVVDDADTEFALFFGRKEGGNLGVGDEMDVADPRGEFADGVEAPADFAVVGEAGGIFAGGDQAAAGWGFARSRQGRFPLGAVSRVVAVDPSDDGVDGVGVGRGVCGNLRHFRGGEEEFLAFSLTAWKRRASAAGWGGVIIGRRRRFSPRLKHAAPLGCGLRSISFRGMAVDVFLFPLAEGNHKDGDRGLLDFINEPVS